MTVSEVAERLRVSTSYAYRMLRQRRMPVIKVGDLPRVSERDFAKYLASRREAK